MMPPAPSTKILAALFLSAVFAAVSRAGEVTLSRTASAPAPLKMRADVSAYGNTSSLNSVDIAKVTGTAAPATYAGTFIHPYSGFSWFVSRHYAVFSDLPDDAVRDALVLLELAWPQYARIFRWRPPQGVTFRQAIVFAHDRETLEQCMRTDCLYAKLLGGLTQEGFACSYLYAGSAYQTRYILLHEATHLYQYCLSGDTRSCYGFMLEGIADYLSSHIFDPDGNMLAVNVLDRAPIHNHLANGLADWRKLGEPDFSDLYKIREPTRGISVLMTAFLQHDREFEAKWRLFCERVVRDREGPSAKAATDRALVQFYGKPESLDKPFRDWLSSLTPTFEILSRDFDQQGDTLISQEPASAAAPARMRINTENLSATATGNRFIISRPSDGVASAGISQCGATFTIGNTWSGGCVFTLKTASDIREEEIPVGFMKDYQPPFTVNTSLTDNRLTVAVSDLKGAELTKDLSLPVPSASDASILIFASEPGITFRSDLFTKFPKGSLDVIKLPETTFPDYAGTTSVTDWKVLGPFTETNKPSVLPAKKAKGAWKTAAAHPATPTTPPLANLAEAFGEQTIGHTVYAAAEITAEAETTADFVIGVADSAKVFLNGRGIGRFDGKREWSDGNLSIHAVPLKKGVNRLLLELTSRGNVPLLSVWMRDRKHHLEEVAGHGRSEIP